MTKAVTIKRRLGSLQEFKVCLSISKHHFFPLVPQFQQNSTHLQPACLTGARKQGHAGVISDAKARADPFCSRSVTPTLTCSNHHEPNFSHSVTGGIPPSLFTFLCFIHHQPPGFCVCSALVMFSSLPSWMTQLSPFPDTQEPRGFWRAAELRHLRLHKP